jgi:hypothetical protein
MDQLHLIRRAKDLGPDVVELQQFESGVRRERWRQGHRLGTGDLGECVPELRIRGRPNCLTPFVLELCVCGDRGLV